jgi:hypothetical protein
LTVPVIFKVQNENQIIPQFREFVVVQRCRIDLKMKTDKRGHFPQFVRFRFD